MVKPVPMSKETLVVLLDDIKEHVEAGDSFEGYLNYLMPTIYDPPDADYLVEARYRIGNLQGQGGMRIIGEI